MRHSVIRAPTQSECSNEVKQPSLSKAKSSRPLDDIKANKLHEFSPSAFKLGTMGINMNKMISSHPTITSCQNSKDECDKTKENYDSYSIISKNDPVIKQESLSSKISVSSINSCAGGKTNKNDYSMMTNQLKDPEIKINNPNMIINPQKYMDTEK